MTKKITQKAIKSIFILLGSLFVVIGFIGIFLPLLPTTPFLLLAALCYERGSDQFHQWLIHHRYFGPPILDWQRRKVIRTKYKLLAASMMLLSAFFLMQKPNVPLIGKLSYLIFMVLMLSFIFTRKSK
jgi:uncharacterized membrane protein YbaN (DUF454 family)